MKLLVTGFEPFGGERLNSSLETLERLPERWGDLEILPLVLPVCFGRAAEMAAETADAQGVDGILCLGQAGSRGELTPEFWGCNFQDARIPDNAGAQPRGLRICPGGPERLPSTLSPRRMAEAIRRSGVPAQVSESAGAFVCNDLLYRLLYRYQAGGPRVGFLHLPRLPAQGEPSLSQAQLLRGVLAAMEGIGPGEEKG